MANYLYNGVELPALPEWDKTAYPYAAISCDATRATLLVSSHPYRVWASKSGETELFGIGYADEDSDAAYYYTSESGTWDIKNAGIEYPSGMAVLQGLLPWIWANYDLLNKEDGTLYLAASEPVPVPVYDHTAMVQGWIVGKRLAAMRKGKKPDEPAEPVPFVSRDGDTIILMGAYKATLTDGILEVV